MRVSPEASPFHEESRATSGQGRRRISQPVEKVGVVETAAEVFSKRSKEATGKGMMKFLRKAPKAAPSPEDRIR
jgi:hypothetical protein